MLKKIEALVQSQGHCVLATCSAAGEPHASLMGYCAAKGLGEFWLATLPGTRKHSNLLANPRASLLIDDRSGGAPNQALTVTAVLAPFDSAREEGAARRTLREKHGNLSEFLSIEGVVVLRLVARRFQLLCGPTDVFTLEVEKKLDGSGLRA